MTKKSLTRREFIGKSTIAAAGFWIGTHSLSAKQEDLINKQEPPSDRLNIGIIGTANRAASNITGVSSQNIVAVCDIDDNYLSAISQKYPDAKSYNDFRKLLEQKDIDAVVISTADHTHAVATIAALNAGKHVYCEKPLAHTVFEARAVAQAAAKNKKLATQMGTQIHAGNNYRRVVELVQSGAIGKVSECHVWCEKSWSGGERPAEKPSVPKNLHWNLWLGPVVERPYHPSYLPKTWRRWWDFGGGTLGDMGCHYMDLAFWALKLRHPLTIESEGPPVKQETTPAWLIVRYEYEAREGMPPARVTWYDGGRKPDLVMEGKVPLWKNGVLFVGDKGMLVADYDQHKLLPEPDFAGFTPPPQRIPNSVGHYNEWIRACKHGSPTTCNFDYAGALSEAILLGNVAYRTGTKLEWDAIALKAKNCKDAANYIKSEYRKGWSLV
ncbi:Gfo/Idh/MocA family protein [Pedosphaera parvula]|uniref:Oxidoreductase domain protein n=1 Tax=Pedosphaera parvula (strain Ellin514) TaxID=320771 RepID=B9XGI3_PEDPL|nr:Gfo/Idh/MocA family oxidoreductase [Pedosphaera parvula]EEF61034.1 oxidoreductase domain protein [Pedosphaera parvula Ellin514]